MTGSTAGGRAPESAPPKHLHYATAGSLDAPDKRIFRTEWSPPKRPPCSLLPKWNSLFGRLGNFDLIPSQSLRKSGTCAARLAGRRAESADFPANIPVCRENLVQTGSTRTASSARHIPEWRLSTRRRENPRVYGLCGSRRRTETAKEERLGQFLPFQVARSPLANSESPCLPPGTFGDWFVCGGDEFDRRLTKTMPSTGYATHDKTPRVPCQVTGES